MTEQPGIKALVFDVFGTVVDWRGSVIREGEALAGRHGLQVDWPAFADQWRREGYHGGIRAVREGRLPWTEVEQLLEKQLRKQLAPYGLTGLTDGECEELLSAWQRLQPWPDSVPGLTRLKQRYIIAVLSNGSLAQMVRMAKYGGLPWDCIFSSDISRHYKPDREVYLGAVKLLGLEAAEVMLVAAHLGDLEAARAQGLRTAYVPRPLEWGVGGPQEKEPAAPFDYRANDFIELADQLGAD